MHFDFHVCFTRFEYMLGAFFHSLDVKIPKIFVLAPSALANEDSFLVGMRAENERFFSG